MEPFQEHDSQLYLRTWVNGSPGTSEGYEHFLCQRCGAFVGDVDIHNAWHELLPPVPFPTPVHVRREAERREQAKKSLMERYGMTEEEAGTYLDAMAAERKERARKFREKYESHGRKS